MTQVGAGKYTYELKQNFPRLPAGESFRKVSSVATDSQDRLYVFQRKNPPVMIFDREGNYLDSWGNGVFADPHSMTIVDDIAYVTDREDSVALIFTLDGKPLQVIGRRGVHSDSGGKRKGVALRAAGPFNHPTRMTPSPGGDLYVSDGYRNCRVHRFTRDGQLIHSWGQPGKTAPGEFHLPHSVLVAPDGKVYVCDRGNRRVQIFSADGEFIRMWTCTGGPNDIARDKDGIFYICGQRADGAPPFVSIRDGAGMELATWAGRRPHGMCVDSHGDIYVESTMDYQDGVSVDITSVDKYVRK